MAAAKSPRNHTIDTPLCEGGGLLSRCLRADGKPIPFEGALDRTIIGDTFEVLPLLPSGIADLIIADPPYNLKKSFCGKTFPKRTEQEYESYTRRWLSAVKPLLKENGTIYVCCDWESGLVIGRVLSDYFRIRNRITWQREKGRGAKANWKSCMEDIWFATNGDDYTFNLDAVKLRRRVLATYRVDGEPRGWSASPDGCFRDTCPSNFWDDITVPFWSMSENTAHPTQKPEKLFAKLILASSNEGGLVLDPFLGSGTSSVAAKKLGRHYIGIELEEQYCLWAEQRLAAADTDKTIQGYSDGIFRERHF